MEPIDQTPQSIIEESVNDIAVARLMLHVQMIEQMNEPARIEEYDAMVHALSFLMDQDSLVQWSTRDINPGWLETMVANA